jgi:hypothetical protein
MNDPKTTMSGVITFVAWLLAHFGIVLPTSAKELILALGVAVIGYLARDRSKNPAQPEQP